MGISGSEIFIIFVAVLLLFGSKKIPEIAKGLGKGMREFKKATDEIKREINNAPITKDFTEIRDDLKQEFSNPILTKDINEIGDSINHQINNSEITKDINEIQKNLNT